MFVARLVNQLARWGPRSGDGVSIFTSAFTSAPFYGGKGAAATYARKKLRDYQFPEIRTDECEQKYISGWGPGGQKVNTAQNAVFLKHKATNLSVKVHESRLLSENINIAFERLQLLLDKQLNSPNSYCEQFDRLVREKEKHEKNSRAKRRTMRIQDEESA